MSIRPDFTAAEASAVGACLAHCIEEIADAGETGDNLRNALRKLQEAADPKAACAAHVNCDAADKLAGGQGAKHVGGTRFSGNELKEAAPNPDAWIPFEPDSTP